MVRKYLRNCKRLFPVYGKYEHQFLKRLKENINAYIAEFPDLTYEKLIAQFGSPKEVVMAYYDNVDNDCLLKRTNLSKNVRNFLALLITIAVIFFAYRSYVIFTAYQEAKDSVIIHEETIIEKLD